MRCLVTGASGHLGSHLVHKLIDLGAEVHVLVRPQSDLWRISDVLDRVGVLRADMIDLSSVKNELMVLQPEVVFHLAWHGVGVDNRNIPEQVTHNVMGSLEFFKIVQLAGCGCWVGVGSQAEYGPYSCALTEDLPTNPLTAYGVSKLCVGLLTQKLCELAGIRYVWFRLLATYGPKDDERHLIPATILHLLAGERPSLTDGNQEWDYLYVDDAADVISRVINAPNIAGVYNLGSGVSRSVHELVEEIRDMIDPSLSLGFGEIPYRENQLMFLQADITRLTNDTGWEPRTNLGSGLKQTIEWYKHQWKPMSDLL